MGKELRGGKRANSGRKPMFGEPSMIVRIPQSLDKEFQKWLKKEMRLKYGTNKILHRNALVCVFVCCAVAFLDILL